MDSPQNVHDILRRVVDAYPLEQSRLRESLMGCKNESERIYLQDRYESILEMNEETRKLQTQVEAHVILNKKISLSVLKKFLALRQKWRDVGFDY